jgi:hypothetical protein
MSAATSGFLRPLKRRLDFASAPDFAALIPATGLASLTKPQQTQPFMVNPLLSVMVYFV